MKPPLPALLHGTGLLLAFAAGWYLHAASSPHRPAALASPALPARPPGPPVPQKRTGPSAASGKDWMAATAADLAVIHAARQPGVVNQVLIDKLKAVLALPDKFQRRASWQGLMSELRPEDAPAVREIFRGLDQDGRWAMEEFRSFFHQWGAIDGAAAAGHLTGSGSNAFMVNYIGTVMEGWGRQDPTAAMAWLKTVDVRTVNVPAPASGLFQGVASVDFRTAESLLLTNFAGTHMENYLTEAAQFKVQQTGLTEAGLWFQGIAAGDYPDAYKRESLNTLTQLTQRLASLPGVTASSPYDLLAPYARESWLPNNAGQAIGTYWSKKDRIAGIAEIQQMTSPGARDTALRSLTHDWAANEPESLSLWLNANKGHANFDQAAYELTRSLIRHDPETAQAWAGQIKDPELKAEASKVPSGDPFDP